MKHGPRTILLKLLTILLFGSPFRWWTRQQVTAGLIPQQSQLKKLTLHVQLLSRAINVKIVELVGINQFQMFATVNTKEFPRGINSDQVISSPDSREVVDSVHPGPGLNHQASNNKRQASSTKHQAFEPTCSIAKRQASQPE